MEEESGKGGEHNNENDSEHAADDGSNDMPISCHLVSDRGNMFRVTRSRGKALQSGGFGVSVAILLDENGKEIVQGGNGTSSGRPEETFEEMEEQEDENRSKNSSTEDTAHNKKTNQKVFQYLFLEEVLFLSEQGLLECYSEPSSSAGQNSEQHCLTSSQLYSMLSPMNLPMASYLVYAHLRQQTFRVMRYSPERLDLLQQMEECQNNKKQKRRYQLQLRTDVQQSPPPAVIWDQQQPAQQQSNHNNGNTPQFAFCVYPPDAQFSKANPGMPAFLVAVTYFGLSSTLRFTTLQSLLQQANGIPVKIATVADAGTVVMFGISDYGVPTIYNKTAQGKQAGT